MGYCAAAAESGNKLDFETFKKNSVVLEANSDVDNALISDCLFSAGQWEEGIKYIQKIKSSQMQGKAKEFATESLFKSLNAPKTITELIKVFKKFDLGSKQTATQSDLILLARFLPYIEIASSSELDQLSNFATTRNQPLQHEFINTLIIPLYVKAGEIDKAKKIIGNMKTNTAIVMGLLSLALASDDI